MGNCGRPKKVVKSFDETKESLLEEVILHVRNPSKFPLPRILTHEEIAILFAKDEKSMLTKMAICKQEQKALVTMRKPLARMGVTSADDICLHNTGRSYAKMYGSTDCPE